MKKLLFVLSVLALNSYASDISEYDLSSIQPGEHKIIEWLGLPVLVLNLNESQKDAIKSNKHEIRSDKYQASFIRMAKSYGNQQASLWFKSSFSDRQKHHDRYSILLGINPLQGCAIKVDAENNILRDPCSSYTFSFDGRIVNPHPEHELSLFIPPYKITGIRLEIENVVSESDFIDFTPDVLASNSSLTVKFFDSIEWNKLEYVKVLLEKHPTLVRLETRAQCNPVHLAATRDIAILEYLIDNGFDINQICIGGETPLMFAGLDLNVENARLLIQRGAKYKAFCSRGRCSVSLENHMGGLGYSESRISAFLKSIGVKES
ncbi:ankyrin repeat domain-containing protein [Endozoicomonadaceae bacterium StTr2]